MRLNSLLATIASPFAILVFPIVAWAAVVANFAGDYRDGSAVGQTSQEVGIAGRVTGAWNYYSDDNHTIDGSEVLLTYVNQVGGSASNGDSGYVGTNTLRFAGLGNFPAISSGLVYQPQFVPALTSGVLQVHPGDPTIEGNPILAVQYLATAGIENVSLNYQLQAGADAGAETDYQIVQVVGGVPSTLVPATVLGSGVGTGTLSVGASDMAAGDSIWFFLDSGFTNNVNDAWPAGDATNVGLEIVADPLDVMTLRVDTISGGVWLTGPDNVGYDLDGYSISSTSGQLMPGGWSSLQEDPSFGNGVANDLSGWEVLGPGIETQVGEFNPDGSSVFGFGGTSEKFLGNLFAPGGMEDLELSVSIAGGALIVGDVEYFEGESVDGDYNQDGVVNAADYVVWRDKLGGTSLSNEGASPGTVDQQDYTFWRSRFGAPSAGGSTAGMTSVPEPTAMAFAIPLALFYCFTGRPQRWRSPLVTTLALAVLGFTCATASATRTLDRDYQLGDDPLENATVNTVLTGNTFDTTGSAGQGDFQDLSPIGDPRYVDVSARPYPGPSQLGIEFDGNGDFLQGMQIDGVPGLGFPGSDTFPNPNADYAGITTRGIQMWVLPTASNTGQRQDLINDTYQFGIHITDDDHWGMTWGSPAHASTGRIIESTESVQFNTWTHVQQHSFGNQLGVLYVNGVAVASSQPQETYALFLPGGTTPSLDLSVGAGLALDGSNPFTGVLDNIEIYVAGQNAAMDYGTFNLEADNEYIAGFLADEGYTTGDLTGDGVVMGDGTGGINDDVAVFLANWNHRKLLNGSQVSDLSTRLKGDFDFDGLVGLLDWGILRDNHVNGSGLNLAQLLAGGAEVPEPRSLLLAIVVCIALAFSRVGRKLTWARIQKLPLGAMGRVRQPCKRSGFFGTATSEGGFLMKVARHTSIWGVSLVFALAIHTTAQAQFIADLQADYDSHLHVNEGMGTGIADTSGLGTWGYFYSDVGDFSGGAPALTPLVFRDTEVGIRQAKAYDGINSDFTLPTVTSGGVFTVQPDAAPDELAIHPGYAPTDEMLWITWTSGISGNVGISGWIHNISTDGATDATYDGVDLSVFSNSGTLLDSYLAPSWAFTSQNPETNKVPISTSVEVNVGDTVYFRADSRSSANGDNNGLQLQIKLGDASPKLTINRATGEMVLANNTVSESYQLTSYSIRSDSVGALDPSQWLSIAENYDTDGNDAVDPNFNWIEFTAVTERDNLSEGQELAPGANGVEFADGDSIMLGDSWIRNPMEDVTMQLLVENSEGNSEAVNVDVDFVGTEPIVGDFNFVGGLTADDWAILKTGFSTNLSGFSLAETYQQGDFNQDGRINLVDARLFIAAYDELNGTGSFAAMNNSLVPEPGSFALLAVGLACALCHRQLQVRRR